MPRILRIPFAGSVFIALLVGCTATSPPVPEPPPPAPPPPPKVALVLGGGAARGFAHVGVIRALEQEKIPIDLIVGTSVGSLIGAMYADNRNSFELEWAAFLLEKDDIFDFSLLSSRTGPVKGDRLEKFVTSHVKAKTIEELKVPFFAVAADLNSGEPVVFSSGPVGRAVRASSSIPGIFTPVSHNGRRLVDGGVLGNLAPQVARQMGATFVIAVNIGKNVSNDDTENILTITLQAINIMGKQIDACKVAEADIVISPEVGEVGTMDFAQKKKCMSAGIEAGQKAIPEIRRKLAEWQGNPMADTVP